MLLRLPVAHVAVADVADPMLRLMLHPSQPW